MIEDNDNVLKVAEKHLKDIEGHLKSGSKPVTSADVSNTGRCVVDGIKSGIEDNTGGNKETTAVLEVSLKQARESFKALSNALSPLSRQVTKSLSNDLSSLSGKVKKGGK